MKMEYIYLLHYETETLGTVWSKAYRSQPSAHNGLSKALGEELAQHNHFKFGDQNNVELRNGKLYIEEILIETE